MESLDVPADPTEAQLAEQVLKARRLVTNFVNEKTEAVIIVKGNGRYAMLDLQASRVGKYRLLPDELLNERWREVLPRPAKVVREESPTPVHPDKPPLPNPVIPKPLETALKTVADDQKPTGKISGKQS